MEEKIIIGIFYFIVVAAFINILCGLNIAIFIGSMPINSTV